MSEELYGNSKKNKEIIVSKLREKGCRITKQRLILLDIILTQNCASCKEIFYQASRMDGSIGPATVYRMIHILEEIGAIDRKNMYKIHCADYSKEDSLPEKEIYEKGGLYMHEASENYLETIYILMLKSSRVRAVDVANELGYSKASVSNGIRVLKQEGYVINGEGTALELTEKGRFMAEKIFERHMVLTKFLEKYAQVSTEIAEKDACKIEHIISEEVFGGLKKHVSEGLS